MMEGGPQLGYGTIYDQSTGYFYQCPVMLVGSSPGMPGQPMHNVLTAVPCGPVPLRPIEWVNPAFVPNLANQQYCVMDYQVKYGRCYESNTRFFYVFLSIIYIYIYIYF